MMVPIAIKDLNKPHSRFDPSVAEKISYAAVERL
jgi:hypothetical protein